MADRLFFEQLASASVQWRRFGAQPKPTLSEKFYFGTRYRVIKVIIKRMAQNDGTAARCLNALDIAESSSLDCSAISTT